jgi:hypothetical protein
MKNISKEDYIIWDSVSQSPLEDLEVVYHYTTLIDIVNDGFKLREGHSWMCVASLPIVWQKKISKAIESAK